ncbi:MAG: hypothetical protein IT349_09140 [Candidatus Eisenbacteria bacterium]|nr:hypothetical protein [Candidatus Eisenbacteria bacterium]
MPSLSKIVEADDTLRALRAAHTRLFDALVASESVEEWQARLMQEREAATPASIVQSAPATHLLRTLAWELERSILYHSSLPDDLATEIRHLLRPRRESTADEAKWAAKDRSYVLEELFRQEGYDGEWELFVGAQIPKKLLPEVRALARAVLESLPPGSSDERAAEALGPYFPIIWGIPPLKKTVLRVAAQTSGR